MKSKGTNTDKELYRELRGFSCERLWNEEVPRFNQAAADERLARVGMIRAIGVVFSESGTFDEKRKVKAWLVGLLRDPSEKIRRYAMAALPKVGAGPGEEAELVSLLRTSTVEREKKFLRQALDKIGGTVTLEMTKDAPSDLSLQTEQKVKASVARQQSPGAIGLRKVLSGVDGLQINLRGRKGLERIVHEEAMSFIKAHGKFRILDIRSGLVSIAAVSDCALSDIYSLRCFGTTSFVLGVVPFSNEAEEIEALAAVITSSLSQHILKTLTQGAIRYRLDFVARGHLRGMVRRLANRSYALCPEILNDAHDAPWAVEVHSGSQEYSVELRPRLVPDPRFDYRRQDVPAASHPPLAACMARLAGSMDREVVWDPFCGSGLELIERSLLGGVRKVYGTDRDVAAIAIAEANFAAAKIKSPEAKFICCDFRDFASIESLNSNRVTLIITNPPMGKRVPVKDLRGLIEDLFLVSAKVLQPGGRLVFANPLRMETPTPSLQLQSRQVVDFGGFDCRLEKYLKVKH